MIISDYEDKFLIIVYKILESSSAMRNSLLNSSSSIILSWCKISKTAMHSNTEPLAVVK